MLKLSVRLSTILPCLAVAFFGLAPALLSGCAAEPELSIEPTSIDFGLVVVNSQSSQPLVLSNTSTVDATVTFQVEDGPFAVDLGQASAVEIAAEDSRQIYVTVTPTTAGDATSVLSIYLGGVEADPQTVSLRVTGVSAQNADADSDGYVDEALGGADGVPDTGDEDCDDTDPDVHPGAPEVCGDGIDNDCSGAEDDGPDIDLDTYNACEECDDFDEAVNPGATEVCNAIDDNCDDVIDEGYDEDGDGYTTCGEDGFDDTEDDDCNDDPNGDGAEINPGVTELCNGIDEDCDDEIDEDFLDIEDDVDQDGEPGCHGDCDDNNPDIHTQATEVCNLVDDDCDCTEDTDGDGTLCDPGDDGVDEGFDEDEDGVFTCGPDGNLATTEDNDCDDLEVANYPGNAEICDALDNDCDCTTDSDGDSNLCDPGDTGVDEGFDADGDTYTTCGEDGDLGTTTDNDCNDDPLDSNSTTTYPGATQLCGDGVTDNDCDGVPDENDFDGDSDGSTTCEGDCDNSNGTVYPEAVELCDGLDNDCDCTTDSDGDGNLCDPGDLNVDEGNDDDSSGEITADETFDADEDGVTTCGEDGDASATEDNDCSDDPGADPDAANTYPGATPVCDDTLDNDCDENTDDNEVDDDGDGETECAGDCSDDVVADANAALRESTNVEACDAIDNDCDCSEDTGGNGTLCDAGDTGVDEDFDEDADGVSTCGPDGDINTTEDNDCLDDPGVNAEANTAYPGADEFCETGTAILDNDCDEITDDNEIDDDSDSETECEGDCNDGDNTIYSAATEVCSDPNLNCNEGDDPGPCSSCAAALSINPFRTDGVYTLDSDGVGSLPEFEAYCDMTIDGGGWTLIQRTTYDGAANVDLITDYATLYGTSVSDGNFDGRMRVAAQHWAGIAADGASDEAEFMSGNVLRKDSDGSDCDPFYYKTTLGTLTVPSDPSSEGAMTFDGTSINHVVKGTELSTTDFGVANTLCVNAFAMVPWFYGTTGLCSFNIPSIGGGSQSVYAPASAPVPLLHQNMLTNAEALNLANGVTDTTADVCGADAVQYLSPYYYQNSHELYLR